MKEKWRKSVSCLGALMLCLGGSGCQSFYNYFGEYFQERDGFGKGAKLDESVLEGLRTFEIDAYTEAGMIPYCYDQLAEAFGLSQKEKEDPQPNASLFLPEDGSFFYYYGVKEEDGKYCSKQDIIEICDSLIDELELPLVLEKVYVLDSESVDQWEKLRREPDKGQGLKQAEFAKEDRYLAYYRMQIDGKQVGTTENNHSLHVVCARDGTILEVGAHQTLLDLSHAKKEKKKILNKELGYEFGKKRLNELGLRNSTISAVKLGYWEGEKSDQIEELELCWVVSYETKVGEQTVTAYLFFDAVNGEEK